MSLGNAMTPGPAVDEAAIETEVQRSRFFWDREGLSRAELNRKEKALREQLRRSLGGRRAHE